MTVKLVSAQSLPSGEMVQGSHVNLFEKHKEPVTERTANSYITRKKSHNLSDQKKKVLLPNQKGELVEIPPDEIYKIICSKREQMPKLSSLSTHTIS